MAKEVPRKARIRTKSTKVNIHTYIHTLLIAKSASDVIIQTNETEYWKIGIVFKRVLTSVSKKTVKTKIWPSFSSYFSPKTIV